MIGVDQHCLYAVEKFALQEPGQAAGGGRIRTNEMNFNGNFTKIRPSLCFMCINCVSLDTY
jgi:hypothetical protein